MIFATKCPHCQTTFRVTEDQLKLYDGAVRCGVCQQIFNGNNHLQEPIPESLTQSKATRINAAFPENIVLGDKNLADNKTTKTNTPTKIAQAISSKKEPADTTISLSDESINASAAESEALFDALEEELSTISLELGQVAGELFDHDTEEEIKQEDEEKTDDTHQITPDDIVHEPPIFTKTPAKPVTNKFASLSLYPEQAAAAKNTVYSTGSRLDDVADVSPSIVIEGETIESVASETQAAPQKNYAALPETAYSDASLEAGDHHHAAFFEIAEEDVDDDLHKNEPDFVRRGRKKKGLRLLSGIFLSLATITLLAVFFVQCLYMFSDRIIVWWPPAEPTVTKACEIFSCPRRLETRISSLSIESSELQTIPPLTDKYILSVLIRNSGSSYQSWPCIELTLTDPDKKPVVRRAFLPANYLTDAERIIKGIPPYSEETINLYLEIQTDTDVDYQISLFYP